MIFIISRNLDASTNQVIRWLLFYKIPFERINLGDFFNDKKAFSLSLSSEGRVLHIDNRVYTEKKLRDSVVWFRKVETINRVKQAESLHKSHPGIAQHVKKEFDALIESFASFFHDAHWLCDHRFFNLSKVYVLSQAVQCGLRIPDTLLTNSKKALSDFVPESRKITKCIGDGLTVELPDKKRYLLATNMLTGEQISELPDYFFPSTVQTYIDKQIELRIFFIGGKYFTSAIFSQRSECTQIDFRLFVIDSRPCRMVPYDLPASIRQNLSRLMEILGLNTGSIDMIVSSSGEYYFLEVNPYGQYGFAGEPCNYAIDKMIAEYLIKKSDEKRS